MMTIYQGLLQVRSFDHGYNSAKMRFVARCAGADPEQFDQLKSNLGA